MRYGYACAQVCRQSAPIASVERSTMKKESYRFLEPLRVRWAEVDMQKIVFNGHYLMYFDTAMAGYWRELALPYADTMASLGGDLFVRKSTVEYLASAEYDDRLQVGLRCERMGNSSMVFVASVFRDDVALVTGELVYVYANPDEHKSQPIPEVLRRALLAFEAGEPMLNLSQECVGGRTWKCKAKNRLDCIVGSASLVMDDPQQALLRDLLVHPGVRGSGIGSAVIASLVEMAVHQGASTLSLDTPHAKVPFFERVGFQRQGASTVDVTGLPQQRMSLKLNS